MWCLDETLSFSLLLLLSESLALVRFRHTHTNTQRLYPHAHTYTHTMLHFIQQNDVSLLSGGCPTLPPIDNGDVVVSGLSTGDTATYTCNSGYQLEGEPTRTCQANGLWSSTAPICTGQIPSQPSDHSRILYNLNAALIQGIHSKILHHCVIVSQTIHSLLI